MVKRTHDEINPDRRRAAKLMKRIVMHFQASVDEELRPYGATIAQVRLLWAIRNAPGSSGAHLSRECEVTPQTTQALLERAEESGWILRGKDSVNERIVTASLTSAGEELLSMADRHVKALEARLWKGVPATAIDELIELLEKCLHNISSE
jgi:DNA-binding MarR family transcriptional regulator